MLSWVKYWVIWRWPIGVIERVVDQLRRNAEARGLVAIDGDLELRRARQEIGGDVGQFRQGPHLLQHLLRPFVQLGDVRVLQVYWKLPRAMRPPTVMSCAG